MKNPVGEGNIIIKTTYDISLDFQDSLLPLGFLSLRRVLVPLSPYAHSIRPAGRVSEERANPPKGPPFGRMKGERREGPVPAEWSAAEGPCHEGTGTLSQGYLLPSL